MSGALPSVRTCQLRVDLLQETYVKMYHSYHSNGGIGYGGHVAITKESLQLVSRDHQQACADLARAIAAANSK